MAEAATRYDNTARVKMIARWQADQHQKELKELDVWGRLLLKFENIDSTDFGQDEVGAHVIYMRYKDTVDSGTKRQRDKDEKHSYDLLTGRVEKLAEIRNAYDEMARTGVYVPQTPSGHKLTLEPFYSDLEKAAQLGREEDTSEGIDESKGTLIRKVGMSPPGVKTIE